MAARRGKSQARRNQGNSGLPGWAWGAIGLLLGVGLFMAVPKLFKSDGDGFFRPRPNPDAQPAPVAIAEDDVAPEGDAEARGDDAKTAAKVGGDADKSPEYDFYTLLPGKEVALSDAELAATERAEAQRAAAQADVAAQATATGNANVVVATTNPQPQSTLPQPVTAGSESAGLTSAPVAGATPPARSTRATAVAADDNTRYLLQAGAFQASGQAEELKARIALLGLGARVESASLGGKTVYRVRMGPYGTASDLAEAKRKLASGGLPGLAIKVK